MKTEIELNAAFLYKESYGEQSREPYTDDEWDRGDTYTSWSFNRVSKTKNNDYPDKIYADFEIKPGDTVHLVIAIWSTGDSFGHDSGACSECFGIYQTHNEAEQRRKELIATTGSRSKYTYPWGGHFESLDSVEVLEFVVEA